MKTFPEKIELLISTKDRTLAKEIMAESRRRNNPEFWVLAFLISEGDFYFSEEGILCTRGEEKEKPIPCKTLVKQIYKISGFSFPDLALAYQSVLKKYEDFIFLREDSVRLRRPLPSKTTDELKVFVRDCCSGHIFTSAQVYQEDLLGLIFMPLLFGSLETIELDSIGVFYEYMKKAGPRSINGYPIFHSIHFLNREDWARCLSAIIAEQKRRNEIVL